MMPTFRLGSINAILTLVLWNIMQCNFQKALLTILREVTTGPQHLPMCAAALQERLTPFSQPRASELADIPSTVRTCVSRHVCICQGRGLLCTFRRGGLGHCNSWGRLII